MKTVYLCGPINGCTDSECKDWRGKATQYCQNLGLNVLDPMRRDFRGREAGAEKEIVEGDKEDVRNSEIILVYYFKPSIGTAMEILYAYDYHKTIIVINESGEQRLSPWLTYHATHIYSTLNDALSQVAYVRWQ